MKIPVALTIAGSDCSAGAGLQADLKTFSSLGVHGLTAVTCVVSETPLVVNVVHPVPPDVLKDQIQLLLQTYPVAAIKTGMLYSASHIIAVCEILAETNIPLIVDPVMVASTGTPLLVNDALSAVSNLLLPLATVITPNLPEAELLLGREIKTLDQHTEAAHELAQKFQNACYLKGGHFLDHDEHRDLLVSDGNAFPFFAQHLDLPHTHGTGCTLSAALTAGLAHQKPLPDAAGEAHLFTHRALRDSISWHIPNSPKSIFHLQQHQPPREND